MEFNNEEEMNEYIFTLPISQIKEEAIANGSEISEEKMFIYLDGSDMAFETESEESGKTTVVIDNKSGSASMIDWDQKMAIVIQSGDMEKIQGRSSLSNDEDQSNSHKFIPTGKKNKISGFDCEEYLGKINGNPISVWASSSNAEIID